MNQVQEIKIDRENIEKKFKEVLFFFCSLHTLNKFKVKFDMSNDFLKSYTDNGVVNEEKISNDKIQELFQPLKAAVTDTITRQKIVMNDIQKCNDRFCEEKHNSGSDDRENFLKLLATAYDSFFSLKENLVEGTKVFFFKLYI